MSGVRFDGQKDATDKGASDTFYATNSQLFSEFLVRRNGEVPLPETVTARRETGERVLERHYMGWRKLQSDF